VRRTVIPALLAAAAPAAAQSFEFIPPLPGTSGARATAISADGRYVIGACDAPPQQVGSTAYRWLVGAPAAENLNIPSIYIHQEPNCLTAIGNVISGQVRTETTDRGFRWAATGAFAIYGSVPGTNASLVYGLSTTGQIATGISYNTTTGAGQPFRWVSGQIMTGIGNLPGGNLGVGLAISGDGATIVGSSGTVSLQRAFRWTAAGGMQALPLLPGTTESAATAISADGLVIAGRSGSQPFRWTAPGGLQSLGQLPGMWGHEPKAASADGSVIVGVASNSIGETFGFVWTPAAGIQRIESFLQARGISVGSTRIINASGVSGDGQTIVGNSESGAWVARLAPAACYANCDASTAPPILNVLDFTCFLNRFAAADPWANCDASTAPPTLNVLDFTCFLNRFSAGCP
jgi:uncharacterized membrane protein